MIEHNIDRFRVTHQEIDLFQHNAFLHGQSGAKGSRARHRYFHRARCCFGIDINFGRQGGQSVEIFINLGPDVIKTGEVHEFLLVLSQTLLYALDNLTTNVIHNLTLALLNWYDQNKRDFPWRQGKPNAYHIWMCEVMSQQTTMGAVVPYFQKFIDHYPTVHDLAKASEEAVMADWAGLGYYSRARNLHKAAKVIAANGFPENLEDLPGVGRYTAAAINTMAFNKPDVVVDGNVERIVSRLFAVETPLPAAKKELYILSEDIYAAHHGKPGNLAQAFMDLGTEICRPKNPKCMICPVQAFCIAQSDAYPKREAKAAKPDRTATAYWIENDHGEILVERRPDKGLLGGTIGLPCTDLKTNAAPDLKLVESDQTLGSIKHVFTHFTLTLHVKKATVKTIASNQYFWMKPEDITGMSTLFKKALTCGWQGGV